MNIRLKSKGAGTSRATPLHRVKNMVRQANLSQATGTLKIIRKCICIHVEEIKGRRYSPGLWGVGELKRAYKK
jgi:hypothetical protein